jgi:hypothetical protein
LLSSPAPPDCRNFLICKLFPIAEISSSANVFPIAEISSSANVFPIAEISCCVSVFY